jgi:hypothetical protein
MQIHSNAPIVSVDPWLCCAQPKVSCRIQPLLVFVLSLPPVNASLGIQDRYIALNS